MYIYENYPSAWGVGSGVGKFVVEKLNIDFKLFINDELIKQVKEYEKVIEGLYRYKFTYPTNKQITRDYKSLLSIDYKYIISDVRPILIFLIGVIITIDIKNKKNWQYSPESFISLITFIAVALTVQFLFTLANDSYQGELYLSFVSSPHIMWPLFFTVVMSGNYLRNYIGIFSFFGAFKIARGEILNIGISLTMIIFYFYKLTSGVTKAHKLNIFKSMTGLILIIIFLLTYLKFWHSYIFDFIFFKFDFFISLALGEISSNSVLMRFVEFQNIMAFYISNTDALIWGRGLGSYFTFSEFPPVRALEINDFSISEISSGLFYKPHHFINFLLLKGGLIGLSLYIIFCLRFLVMGLKIVKHGNINEKILGYYLFFFSIYCLNMYWQPTLIIWALLIYSFGEVNLRSIENRYSNS